MTGRRHVVDANDVVNAKEDLSARLERPAPSVDEDGDAFWGPSVVCAATTWEDFERWLNDNEGWLKRWDFELLNDGTDRGRVAIHSLSSKVYEDATHTISNSILKQILRAGNDIGLIHTVIGGRVTCWTGDRGEEPDASLTPDDLDVGGRVLAAAHNVPFQTLLSKSLTKTEAYQCFVPSSSVG